MMTYPGTPKRTHPETVEAQAYDDVFGEGQPIDGAFKTLVPENTYFLCVCPCGCGSMMNLPIKRSEDGGRGWVWNGNCEQPSLTPSIRDLSGCRFHGFLTDGVWTFCGDSGVQG